PVAGPGLDALERRPGRRVRHLGARRNPSVRIGSGDVPPQVAAPVVSSAGHGVSRIGCFTGSLAWFRHGEERGDSMAERSGAMGRQAGRSDARIRRLGRAILTSLLVSATAFSVSVFDDGSGDVDDDSDDIASLRRHPAYHSPDSCPEGSTAESRLRVAHLDSGRVWRGGQAQVLMLMEGLARRGVQSVLLAPKGTLLERARDRGFLCEVWSPKGDWDVLAFVQAAR